jgi:hypothetical protein
VACSPAPRRGGNPQAALASLIPVKIEWVRRVHPRRGSGAEFVRDRWGGGHFIVGVRVERPKPWQACCRNGGIKYEADEVLEGESNNGLEWMHAKFSYSGQSEDESALTLKLPARASRRAIASSSTARPIGRCSRPASRSRLWLLRAIPPCTRSRGRLHARDVIECLP